MRQLGDYVRWCGDASRLPLPVRDVQIGGCSGRMVSAVDWATLGAMATVRSRYAVLADQDHAQYDTFVYPWNIVSRAFPNPETGTSPARSMRDRLMPSVAAEFLDPGWEPQGGDGPWSAARAARLYEIGTRQIGPGALRESDDVRMMYRDFRRMRRHLGECGLDVRDSGGQPTGSSYQYVAYDDGTVDVHEETPASATVGAIENLSPAVLSDPQTTASLEFAVIDVVLSYHDFASGAEGTARRHLVVRPSSGSSLRLDSWSPAALRAMLVEEFGQFGVRSCEYYGAASRPSVPWAAHQIDFPLDGILTPWHWEP